MQSTVNIFRSVPSHHGQNWTKHTGCSVDQQRRLQNTHASEDTETERERGRENHSQIVKMHTYYNSSHPPCCHSHCRSHTAISWWCTCPCHRWSPWKGRCNRLKQENQNNSGLPFLTSPASFLSLPQLKPWGSASAGWEGSVRSHFPTTLAHAVLHTSAAWLTSPATALWLQGFQSCSFVMSWRQLELNVILPWNSNTKEFFFAAA